MLCTVLLCYLQILMKTINGFCSSQIMAWRTNTLSIIKSASFIVSWLCQHNLIPIRNSSSAYSNFTNRKDTFYCLVWRSKACAIFPVTEATQIKDVGSHFVSPNTHRDTQWARNIQRLNLQSPGLTHEGNSSVVTSRMAGNTVCMKFCTLRRTASNF